MSDEPQHQRAWDRGAGGEEQVAESLGKWLNSGIVVLHDRRMPGGRGNVDHIAVAPSGVWVIDTKRYKGKVEIRKPLLDEARLLIRGRDKTKLVEGLDRQVEAVRATVAKFEPSMPVQGVMCFLEADLPLLKTLRIRSHLLLYRKALAKRINARGHVTEEQVYSLACALAERFPRA